MKALRISSKYWNSLNKHEQDFIIKWYSKYDLFKLKSTIKAARIKFKDIDYRLAKPGMVTTGKENNFAIYFYSFDSKTWYGGIK